MMEIILFILGLLIGGAISWGITHRYYKKASEDQEKLLAQFSEDLGEKNTLRYFQHILEISEWNKERVGQTERWIAQKNNIYQIERGEAGDVFDEPWTRVYPNSESTRYPVFLKIGDTIIKELTFIDVDGGRIFVPMPKVEAKNHQQTFFWIKGSLDMQVCQVIGDYYIYKNIQGVAKRSRVEIRSSA